MRSSMASAIRRTPPGQGGGGWRRGKARQDGGIHQKGGGRGNTAW
jgi:hypothetical protein